MYILGFLSKTRAQEKPYNYNKDKLNLNFSDMAGQVWRVEGLQVSPGDELGLGTDTLQPPTAGLGTLRQGAGHQHQVRQQYPHV